MNDLFDTIESEDQKVALLRLPRVSKPKSQCLADFATESERQDARTKMQRRDDALAKRERIIMARLRVKADAKQERKRKPKA